MRSRRGTDRRGDVWAFIISALNVAAAAGLVRICGLSDRLYFNKSCLSAAFFLISVVLSGTTIRQLRKQPRTAGVSLALAWLLTFTEEMGLILRLAANGADVLLDAKSVWLTAAGSVPLSFLAEPFFCWLCGQVRLKEEPAPQGAERNRAANRLFFKAWAALFAAYLPCFLAFYPGLYNNDMIWQGYMYATHSYNTWHPILHTLTACGIMDLGYRIFGTYSAGLALHSLFQIALLSGSEAFAVRFLFKTGVSRKIWLSVGVFFAVFPFFAVMAVNATKDVMFAALFLTAFVCLCDMVCARRLWRGVRLVLFVILLILMGLFRNNAMYGLAFASVCLFLGCLFTRPRRDGRAGRRLTLSLAAVFLAAALGTQGAFVLLEKGFRAEKGSIGEMLSVPCQQLGRTYFYHKEEISPKDQKTLLRYIDEEALEGYLYYLSDPVKFGLDTEYLEENAAGFWKLWAGLGLQFPGEYLLAPVYNTMGIWYMGGDSSCTIRFEQPDVEGYETVEVKSLLPFLKNVYSWFTDEHIQEYLPMVSLIFYTSFYAWLVLIAGGVILARGRPYYLVLPLFCMGYVLTLALGPCLTVRYMLAIMLSAPVLGAVVLEGMVK